MRGLQVFQESLGPCMEEVIQWLVKPLAAMPVPVGLAAERVASGALVEEVIEGVGGPATSTSQLVLGDVWAEPAGVVGSEGMANSQTKGGGGGVPRVDG